MKLLDLQNGETNVWEEKGYLLPKYDREELKKKTKENPTWVQYFPCISGCKITGFAEFRRI